MANSYFRTYSGKHVHALAPHPDEIDIVDVARSLAHQCRFLGHTSLDCADGIYSIAQHSVLVSELVPPQDSLWGLLHDASEAYLADLPAPIKCDPAMACYRIAEDRLMACIAQKFGVPAEMPESVIAADRIALATEFRDVTTVNDLDWIIEECGVAPAADHRILPWPPVIAENRFLRRFRDLTK